MLFRFSIYGFLKNLRFFEWFFILFLRQKGLSFTEIGVLIGYRELCITLLEIPSGGIADLYGRRRCMILSFLAYIGSFVLFALCREKDWLMLAPAMTLFAVGEAFRTGTHKAMIFDYLSREGRVSEKTKFYGTTRSWAKTGTAACVVIAAGLVFVSARSGPADYAILFWASLVPYCAGLLNFLWYPRYLDATPVDRLSLQRVVRHMLHSFRDCWQQLRLRSLIADNMTYQGLFESIKDYVQPLVRQWAVLLPLALGLSADRRTALLMVMVAAPIALVEAFGSKQADRFARACRGEERAAWGVWIATLVLYALLAPSLYWARDYPLASAAAAGMFALLYLVANLWRPIQLSRYDAFAGGEKGATILSIEAQAKSLAIVILAPVTGCLVDHYGLAAAGAVGIAVTAIRLLLGLLYRA